MGNQTTVKTTTLGGAIAVLIVAILGQFVTLDPTISGSIVAALTIIINYFVPVKKEG